jgi:hypothetical protein
MVYTLRGFLMSPPPRGLNVAVLGGAGGGSVTNTDFAEKEGLRVPHLADGTVAKLGEIVPVEGNSVKNPLDILPALRRRKSALRVMELLRDDPNIDSLIMILSPGWIYEEQGRTALNRHLETILEARRLLEKPMFMMVRHDDDPRFDAVHKDVNGWFGEQGVPCFPDFRTAARVVRHLKRRADFLAAR